MSSTSGSIKGEFIHVDSTFRDSITADGSSGFKAERDRYHLYVSLACPFAHRTLVVRKLKGLDEVLPITVVDWLREDRGWTFTDKKPKCSLDPLNNCQTLREVYQIAVPGFSDKVTVPVLWDKQQRTIVNNESSEVLRMLNTAFNEFSPPGAQRDLDLYPEDLRKDIDELNTWIYSGINIGVYRCGFATSQEAYDVAVHQLFEDLDKVEVILSTRRYLTGSRLTEADIRLFTTLVRFDMIYVGHFKCNKKRIVDYPNMWGYLRDIYQLPGVAETVDPEHIMKSYQQTHKQINPLGIVSIGPDLDFMSPHGRAQMA